MQSRNQYLITGSLLTVALLTIFLLRESSLLKNIHHSVDKVISANHSLSVGGSLDKEDYYKYVENPENGLQVTKRIKDLIFTAQYIPSEYIAKNGSMINSKDDTSSLCFIRYRINSATNHGDPLSLNMSYPGESYRRAEYFSYHAQKDFSLINGYDTFQCVTYTFEPSRGVLPFVTMLLGFPVKDLDKRSGLIVQYNDTQFNLGRINLLISPESLVNLPNLKNNDN